MKFFILFFSILVFSTFSTAQIVNIEDQRQDVADQGLSGQADFNFTINKNTSVLYQLGNRIQARYKKNKDLYLFFNEINLVKANEESFVNGGFQHLRYNRVVSKKFRWEAFTQSQYNGVQKINWRFLIGAGPRFTLYSTDSLSISFGTLPMYEFENPKGDYPNESTARLSSYLSFKLILSKNANVSSTTYYQPRFDLFSDYRISNESTFAISINEKLSLKVTYNLVYDAFPAIDVPTTIYTLRNAIVYKF